MILTLFSGGGHGAASILQALLPKNILYYLGLLANAESTPPASPNTSLLSMCSAHETDQAIRDAFLSLDRDMMNVATAAITGSRPLARSTIELGAADSASSALVALYDVRTRALRVACVGNSRAVLGRRTWSGRYKAIPLSVDQTGHNEDEVTRLRAEHPNEPDMIKDGRLLGSKITRAFGGLRYVTMIVHPHANITSELGVIMVTKFSDQCLKRTSLSTCSDDLADGSSLSGFKPSGARSSSVRQSYLTPSLPHISQLNLSSRPRVSVPSATISSSRQVTVSGITSPVSRPSSLSTNGSNTTIRDPNLGPRSNFTNYYSEPTWLGPSTKTCMRKIRRTAAFRANGTRI